MKKFHFIWIPKNAGTSIVKALKLKKLTNKHIKSKKQLKGNITLNHASIERALQNKIIDEREFWNSIRFGVVRNPYDRLVSLYFHYKRTYDYFPFHSFNDFAMFLPLINIHPVGLYSVKFFSQLNPQWYWLYDSKGQPFFEFLIRFEQLKESWEIVQQKLGIKVKLPHINTTKHKSFMSYYNKQTKRIVGEFYAQDFKLFNYER